MSPIVKLVLAPYRHGRAGVEDDEELSTLVRAGWKVVHAEPRIVEPGIPKLLVKLTRAEPLVKVGAIADRKRSSATAGPAA
jgi:hypothetical protein